MNKTNKTNKTKNSICANEGGFHGIMKTVYYDPKRRKCSIPICSNIIPIGNERHTCDECIQEIQNLENEEMFDKHGNKCCANCFRILNHNGNYCDLYCYEEAFGYYFDCTKEDSDSNVDHFI
jgi:hypothetical protein